MEISGKAVYSMSKHNILHFDIFSSISGGQWLLFVHGIGGNTKAWKYQIPELQKDFNLIAIDLPGHGKSKNINFASNYTFQNIAEGIRDILDQAQIKKVHLVGVSLGCMFCWDFGLKFPDRTASVILAGSPVKWSFYLSNFLRFSIAISKIIGFRRYFWVFSRLALPRENHLESRNIFESSALSQEKSEIKKWLKIYEVLPSKLNELEKSITKSPMLFIMGEKDWIFLPNVREFVKKYPTVQLVIIKDAGHIVTVESREKFNFEVSQFLNKISLLEE